MSRRPSSQMSIVPSVEIELFPSSRSVRAICRGSLNEEAAQKLADQLRMKISSCTPDDKPTMFILDVSMVKQFATALIRDSLRSAFDFVVTDIGRHVILVNTDDAFGRFMRAFVLGTKIQIHAVSTRSEIPRKMNDIRGLTSAEGL